MHIELDITEVKQLASKFASVDPNKFLLQGLNEGAKRVAKQYEKEVPQDTGASRKGVVIQHGNMQKTITNTQQYLVFVQKGTRPHFPPIQAIEPWANRHGINPFALQRSIGKKGTKANKFMDRIYEKTNQEISTGFSAAMNALIDAMARS